jgi:hypothetical protein
MAVPHVPWGVAKRPCHGATAPPQPAPPRRTRSRAPTPLAGLTTKPHGDACAHARAPYPRAPSAPPPHLVMTRGHDARTPPQKGGEGHWDAMRALTCRPLCYYDSRWVSLGYVSAGCRYTTTPLGILVDHVRGTLHGGVDVFRIAEAYGY